VHVAKVAFEKYFLRKVRKGRSEPVYERFIMKTLRIPKLRRNRMPRPVRRLQTEACQNAGVVRVNKADALTAIGPGGLCVLAGDAARRHYGGDRAALDARSDE
jgi:hypothetical protein